MNSYVPKVAVLMAVKDGLSYLPQQIDSILKQMQCQVSLLISDDSSEDGSAEFLQNLVRENSLINLLPATVAQGSAAKNFYRLVAETDIQGVDYFAYSDQDDIWLPDKLSRHINLIQEHNACAVSSNVTAFWPDGRECILDKAQPQCGLDYLFESAGPGCTFLMTPWLVGKLREQLSDNNSLAKEAVLHDWLTYAVCRAYGGKWVIDKVPSVKYRQHQTNVVGANVGIRAKWDRLIKLKQSWYRNEIIKIATVCHDISANPEISRLLGLLENYNLASRMKLLGLLPKARRKLLDRMMLAGAILLGYF